MQADNFSRDTNELKATQSDGLATTYFLRNTLNISALFHFTRRATLLDDAFFLYKKVRNFKAPKIFEGLLCRVVARLRNDNNNNNNSLSIYTQACVPAFSRDISRDTPKMASRRDIFFCEDLWFLV